MSQTPPNEADVTASAHAQMYQGTAARCAAVFSGQAIAALCAMHAGYHSWHAGGLVRRMPAYPLPDKLVYLAGFGLLLRGRDLIELR